MMSAPSSPVNAVAAGNVTKLALNEACEPPYWINENLINAGSFLVIAPAAAFALWTLVSMKKRVDPLGAHACAAQMLYHMTHAYIHATVDMGIPENAAFWNPFLVFHFAHQSGTLGALHFRSCLKGLPLGFGAVYITWALTGMIYPAVWGYLITVFWFRSRMGWPIMASSVYTGLMTMVEVKLCDPVSMRNVGGNRGFPFHIIADAGQATTVLLQCMYISRRNKQLGGSKVE